ncbi:MAG: hypothetical protein JSV91_03725 [Phycisphaerales bacterium]|nr:MAG: hypothetical protein JSV91_03725 [Phycisphaerales bacterium]
MPEPNSINSPDRAPNPLDAVRAPLDWLARSPLRAFIIIFLLSFAVQCFFLTKASERWVRPNTRWEMPAIAYNLADRGEFADPYVIPTGPTAHLPPVAPGMVALIYRIFGLTLTAGYIALLIRIVFHSTLYAMLPWVAGRLGVGRQPGVIAGLAWAFVADWPGHGEILTAIMLALLLIACVRRWHAPRLSAMGSFLLGMGWAAVFHVQPALLPTMLTCMAFELFWSKDRRRFGFALIILLGAALTCVPWAVRNYAAFGEVFFIRSNFGLELRMGNHDGAAADIDVMVARQKVRHPRIDEDEANLIREVGEIEYMRRARIEAIEWIKANPGEFTRLTASRIAHFWCGPLHQPITVAGVSALTILAALGLWYTREKATIPQLAALVIPLLTFPLVYYIVAYMFRYRLPVHWLILILAAAALWHWIGPSRITHTLSGETSGGAPSGGGPSGGS